MRDGEGNVNIRQTCRTDDVEAWVASRMVELSNQIYKTYKS